MYHPVECLPHRCAMVVVECLAELAYIAISRRSSYVLFGFYSQKVSKYVVYGNVSAMLSSKFLSCACYAPI